MVHVADVAEYILRQTGEITAMKLQKLVYYSQAWSLVWDEQPLFEEEIQAWANGPVVRDLYDCHKGAFRVDTIPNGNPDNLNEDQIETIDMIVNHYGKKSAQWLSELTHMEDPWKCARKEAGLAEGQRGTAVISHASMAEYYSAL
ncbi:MAG: hypothetical protein COA81_01335 [Alphaproteobacteria bacterium]|nr:MAG: hypothetical protein COA81_01335 [Alphaproteobacteria bacterium]